MVLAVWRQQRILTLPSVVLLATLSSVSISHRPSMESGLWWHLSLVLTSFSRTQEPVRTLSRPCNGFILRLHAFASCLRLSSTCKLGRRLVKWHKEDANAETALLFQKLRTPIWLSRLKRRMLVLTTSHSGSSTASSMLLLPK